MPRVGLEQESGDSKLVQMLLLAPDGQLDAKMKPLIEKWDDPPTALQVLEVLDHCVHGAIASGMVIGLFKAMLDGCLSREGKTLEDVTALATWRT